MADENDLPVCTLFKDVDNSEASEQLFSLAAQQPETSIITSSDQAPDDKNSVVTNQISDNGENLNDGIETTKEPVVCDLFQAVPSSEDVFSNLAATNHESIIETQAQDCVTDLAIETASLNIEENATNKHQEETNTETGNQTNVAHVVGDAPLVGNKPETKLNDSTIVQSKTVLNVKNIAVASSAITVEDLDEKISTVSIESSQSETAITEIERTVGHTEIRTESIKPDNLVESIDKKPKHMQSIKDASNDAVEIETEQSKPDSLIDSKDEKPNQIESLGAVREGTTDNDISQPVNAADLFSFEPQTEKHDVFSDISSPAPFVSFGPKSPSSASGNLRN